MPRDEEKKRAYAREGNRSWRAKNPGYHRERCKQWRVKNPDASKKPEKRFRDYAWRAARKNLEFEIIFEDFMRIICFPCAYCGQPGYGIDRVDSSQGYTLHNVVSCCSICNFMKLDYSVEEFIEHVHKISSYNQKALS